MTNDETQGRSDDQTTDPNTDDAKSGILADLENLRAAHQEAPHEEHAGNTSLLDSIADAASSLRGGDGASDESGSGDDAAESAAAERPARGRRPARKSARAAHSNRGSALEDSIFSDADSGDSSESRDEDPVDASQPRADVRPPAANSGSLFSSQQVFSAQDAPVEYAPITAPAGGGLLFQAPQAELGQQVDPDWDDDEDDDTDDDSSSSFAGDADGGARSSRRRGRNKRGADRDDDEAADAQVEADHDESGDSERSDDDDTRGKRRRGGRGRRSKKDSEDDAGSDGDSRDSKQSDSGDKKSDDSDRGSASDSSAANGKHNTDSQKKSSQGNRDHDSGQDDDDDSDNGSRRRRRRSRSGSRSSASTSEDAVQGIKGSTRMEAKRQRRREGREAGRRRPVISEAEFLARRESVDRAMLVREKDGRTQLVVTEDGIAVEHYLSERKAQASLIGNVYLGKVQNVLPSMEAAFIDIGKGRNAVLYAGEVNWDALGMDGKPRRIETALKSGDSVLVQVTKDPIGHKGARLTSQISLPGRFLVYVPGNSMTGISRKLPDVERQRLKKLLKELVPEDAGVIVRTAAEGAAEDDISRDVQRLTKRWETIEKKSKSTKTLAPQLLYSEPDMIVRIVRDVFNEDFGSLVVDGEDVWGTIHEYVESVAPDLLDRVSRYDGDDDIFDHYRVNEQVDKALSRKVNLPSGGSLVIDRTEAMTVIDVNTGKFTGSGGNLEETVTKNNLEAADEVIRQLRLRDIGGIIVVDFIDMVLESNRDLVVRRLVECLGRDRTKHQVAEVTSLGLVQMTRKRIGTGLAESFAAAGEDMNGLGLMLPGTEPEPHSTKGPRSNRKRRGDQEKNSGNSGESKNSDGSQNGQDSPEDDERQSAARSAMAAIAKATLSKDEEAAAADAAQQAAATAEAPAETAPADKGRRRNRRSKKQAEESAPAQHSESAEKQHPGDQQADTAPAKAAPEAQPAEGRPAEAPQAVEPPQPAEPSGPQPLMIGGDAQTRVQQATEPTKTEPRKRSTARASAPEPAAAEPAPPIFIVGQDD